MSSCLFSRQKKMSILSPLIALSMVFVYGKSIKTIQEELEGFKFYKENEQSVSIDTLICVPKRRVKFKFQNWPHTAPRCSHLKCDPRAPRGQTWMYIDATMIVWTFMIFSFKIYFYTKGKKNQPRIYIWKLEKEKKNKRSLQASF